MEDAIQFQLCGSVQSMTLVQFAFAVGLYTEPETNMEGFEEHLIVGIRTVEEFEEVAPVWGDIANEAFVKSGVND